MPEETLLQSKVPPAYFGKSLLDYLSGRFRYQTRENWKDLVGQKKVLVNGEPAAFDRLLIKGDLVAYRTVLNEPAVDKNFRILHEEESFLVVDKPGGLPSHADGNFIKNTLIYLLTERSKENGQNEDIRLVHRLDRETSGLMVVGKTREAHRHLTQQFETGTVEKTYLAVARGRVEWDRLEVNGAIAKDPESCISLRQKVVPEGTPFAKPSLTLFEKLKELKDAALLRCIPKTGRTGQIRVHLASIGHPLVGDKLYGRTDEEFLAFVEHVKAGGSPDFNNRFGAPRQLLHAEKLAFTHPFTGQKMAFTAEIPADFEAYLEKNESF